MLIKPVKDTQLADKLRKYAADHNWIRDNYLDLARRYPDSYIAVKNKEVKYHSETMEDLITDIVSKRDTIAEYVIEFVTEEETSFLL